MRLAKLSEFRRLVYAPGSAPSMRTLRGWIDAGQIPGGRIEHGLYWVDLDEYDVKTGLRAGILDQEKQLATDPLLDGLL